MPVPPTAAASSRAVGAVMGADVGEGFAVVAA